MVEKQIQEDRVRQLSIMNLSHEFNDACTGKDDLQKAYEVCKDILLEQHALIGKFLKIESELDFEMHNALLWQAAKLEKQIIDKTSWASGYSLAERNEFPLAFHVVCCRHLMMNIALKKKKTKALCWKICKAYTLEEFTENMTILQAVQPNAYHKLIQAGPQRLSRAHCPLIRYNYMASNSVESDNACSVFNRKLPITMLTETYREMLQKSGILNAEKLQVFNIL
nr:transposase, MuDR, MULE transposase domain protein [Tanacetum cinerariifolium]